MVRALTAAGAALNARNADGNNAFWFACVGNHLDIIDLLVAYGIDVDNQNDNWRDAADVCRLIRQGRRGQASAGERGDPSWRRSMDSPR